MKYVLDPSVAVKWVLDEQHSDRARRLRDGTRNGTHELLSPNVFPGEAGHALTRAERQGRIRVGDAIVLWSDIMNTCPRLIISLPLTHRAIVISSQTQVSVFDCLYVALADREGCQLVTADSRLVRVVQKEYPFIVDLSSLP